MAHRGDEAPRDVLSAPSSFYQLNDALENVHDKGKPFESMAMNCKRWSPKVRKRKGGQKESAGNSRSRATQIAAAVEPQVVNMEDPNRHSKPKSSGGVVAEVAQLSEEEPKQVIVPTLNIRPSHLLAQEEISESNAILSQTRDPRSSGT